MDEVDKILESLFDRVIEPCEAKKQLMHLFNSKSELLAFREWAKDNYGEGYHDMVWEEWKRLYSDDFKIKL